MEQSNVFNPNIQVIQAGILHVLWSLTALSACYITRVEVVLVIRGFALLSTHTYIS